MHQHLFSKRFLLFILSSQCIWISCNLLQGIIQPLFCSSQPVFQIDNLWVKFLEIIAGKPQFAEASTGLSTDVLVTGLEVGNSVLKCSVIITAEFVTLLFKELVGFLDGFQDWSLVSGNVFMDILI